MKRFVSLVGITLITAAFIPSIAYAARPTSSAGSKPSPAEQVGYDVSYPQCGKKLPTGQAFGVVGVNGGNAATTNKCLAEQLTWANKSVGGSSQPKVQVYVNTANPGEVINQITTWPTNNTDKTGFITTNPYGTCNGTNSKECSWQYGWNRAVEDNLDRFAPSSRLAHINTNASDYVWWLDVETMNTWQSGSSDARARNAAALEGMTAYFTHIDADVGLYSTSFQWGEIVGEMVSDASNLNGLPNWRPSGASLENAKNNCTVAPLTTSGYISLTQYVQQGLDKNHSCI